MAKLYRRLYRSRVSPHALKQLHKDLWQDANLNLDFVILTMTSCFIASLGLLMNSAAVIIGAMIIAPLMMPLRGLALGALDGDEEMVGRSLGTLVMGTVIAILISGLIGSLSQVPSAAFGSEILARTKPTLADLLVAIAAGAVSGFAKIRPKLSDALAGTAISVALMPPLCVVGIGLSQGYYRASGGAFLLYFTNFVGITLSCVLVFAWGGYYVDIRKVRHAFRSFFLMTGILVIPLFFSLSRLIQQERLEAALRERLENETITVGQQTELISLEVFWHFFPWRNQTPTILLTVEAYEPVTPRQVELVEAFLEQRFDQPFKLIFRVSRVQRVTSERPAPENEPKPVELPFMDPISPPPLPKTSR